MVAGVSAAKAPKREIAPVVVAAKSRRLIFIVDTS
jgi:hypothetical protein